jgi:uncharacterized phage-associated protein
MPYPAVAIANEFIRLAQNAGRPLTPMKIQRLVYFAHGWYLGLTGRPLINEPVEAWKFGPVIPSLYRKLKRYNGEFVTHPITDEDIWGDSFGPYETNEFSIDDGPDPEENTLAKKFVKKVWDVYGSFSAVQLSNLTHAKDSPWDRTKGPWYQSKGKPHPPIDPELIRKYFERQTDDVVA